MDNRDSTRDRLTTFFSQGTMLRFKKGEILLRGGETPQGVSFLIRGHVKSYSLDDRGNENIHMIYRPGEIFPLNWLLVNAIRHIYFEALDQVVVRSRPREEIINRARHDNLLTHGLLYHAAAQLHIYSDRLDNLVSYQDAYARVAYRILFLASRFGAALRNGHIQIEFQVTHQSIGDSINLARETVSRMVERLERKKLIYYTGRRLHVPDPHALAGEIDDTISPDTWGLVTKGPLPDFMLPPRV